MSVMLKGYLAELNALTELANQQREQQSTTARQQLQSALGNLKPLTEQIEELMRSLPPSLRDRPWTMAELVSRLEGRYHQRPSAGDVGQALRALGWVRQRDWSAESDGRRVWHPPHSA